jgi:hypothetical protein
MNTQEHPNPTYCRYEIQKWDADTERFTTQWALSTRHEHEARLDYKYWLGITATPTRSRLISVQREVWHGNIETITRTIQEA